MSDTGTRYYARGLSITSAVSLWDGEVEALFLFLGGSRSEGLKERRKRIWQRSQATEG